MASPVRPSLASAHNVREHECRATLNQITHSKRFEKSARSRELLSFLCEFALSNEPGSLTEQRIGQAIFRREPGYDTAADTIARVQVSQLRKKLKDYFASEGSCAPIVIDIPAGSYLPTFHPREQALPPQRIDPRPDGKSHRPQPIFTPRFSAVTSFALLLLCIVLATLLWRQRDRDPAGNTPVPDGLWKSLVSTSRDLPVVVSDANLMIVSDMLALDKIVTLHEYRAADYPESLLQQFPDPKTRQAARHILGNYYTGSTDARVVQYLSRVTSRFRTPLTVISAREFRFVSGERQNMILLGHNKGNPWMELFEKRMNFQYRWPKGANQPVIANAHPLPGEQADYAIRFQHHGYCIVSLQPKPGGNGNALLIIGSDLSSLDAGGRFVTEEKGLRLIQQTFAAGGAPIRYFEALLRTDLLTSGAPDFQMIAYRISPS